MNLEFTEGDCTPFFILTLSRLYNVLSLYLLPSSSWQRKLHGRVSTSLCSNLFVEIFIMTFIMVMHYCSVYESASTHEF